MNIFLTLAYISPVLIPVIVAAFLLFNKKTDKAKAFLAFLMFILSFTFVCNFFYFNADFITYSYLHSLHVGSVLMIYPLVYIYILNLTQKQLNRKKTLVHFIPALFFTSFSAVLFYFFLNTAERIEYLSNYRLNHDFANLYMRIIYFVRVMNVIALFIQIPFYFILANRYLKKHRKNLENHFSSPDGYDLIWINKFNVAFFIAAAVSIFFYAVNPIKLLGNDLYLMAPLYALSFIMCWFGILGNNQDPIALPKEEAVKVEQDGSSEMKEKIRKLLQEEKIYLNPGLKITDVAQMLKSNRTYVSQEINRSYGVSFSRLINRLRLEEAKKILQSENAREFTLDEVAEMCGWRSLSSLNRAFSEEGLSPVKFRKNNHGNTKRNR